jgi:hypothetical protein
VNFYINSQDFSTALCYNPEYHPISRHHDTDIAVHRKKNSHLPELVGTKGGPKGNLPTHRTEILPGEFTPNIKHPRRTKGRVSCLSWEVLSGFGGMEFFGINSRFRSFSFHKTEEDRSGEAKHREAEIMDFDSRNE